LSVTKFKWVLATIGGAGLAYVVLAYLALPAAWKHYEHQKGLEPLPAVTRTAQGIPGDPINIGLIGTQEDVVCSMYFAGWDPADPITFRTSLGIIGSVLLNRPYRGAPVSSLYYQGVKQALAFEKPEGTSADRRNHLRLWPVLDSGEEDRPVWLGTATFDRGIGLSRYTGAVTHHIAPNVDLERQQLTDDLNSARMVEAIYQVSGVAPTINGRNGEGDLYFTDGDIWFSRLVEGCKKRSEPAIELSNPPIIALKNLIWKGVTSLTPKD
jgi:hypothetical protein